LFASLRNEIVASNSHCTAFRLDFEQTKLAQALSIAKSESLDLAVRLDGNWRPLRPVAASMIVATALTGVDRARRECCQVLSPVAIS
jgi:hypothetical protein